MVRNIGTVVVAMVLLFATALPGWAGQEVVLSGGTTVTIEEQEAEALLGQPGMEFSEVAVPLPGGGYLVGSEEDFLAAREAIQTPIPPDIRTLMITKTGTGQGTIVSAPKGINCGPECKVQAYAFKLNQNVTLVPKAAVGSVFSGWWSTACPGLKSCKVKMDGDKSLEPSFMLGTPKITLLPRLLDNNKHFGNTKIGTTKSATFTIKNAGTGFLKIGQIASMQSNQFTVDKDLCSNTSLAPNKPCNFKVYFKPAIGGSCGSGIGRVDIPSDDPDTKVMSFYLSGCPVSR